MPTGGIAPVSSRIFDSVSTTVLLRYQRGIPFDGSVVAYLTVVHATSRPMLLRVTSGFYSFGSWSVLFLTPIMNCW